MYINFTRLFSAGLTFDHLIVLQAIKQKETTVQEMFPSVTSHLKDESYIHQSKNGSYLLTKKGASLLDSIEKAKTTSEIEQVTDMAMELYQDRECNTGSRADVLSRMTWIISTTGFRPDIILKYIKQYLDSKEETESMYVKSLPNLIWSPQSKAFSVKPKLSESPLYDLMVKDMGIDYSLLPTNKKMEWLMALARLPEPPARIDPEYCISGSKEKDCERLKQIKTLLYIRLKNGIL